MYDYTLLGSEVMTPCGIGQYLSHENGKVLVVFDYNFPPVEYEASEVYI